MKARPILFNGPMVRALLEGRKTQTRRVVKPQRSSEGILADATAPTALASEHLESLELQGFEIQECAEAPDKFVLFPPCPYGKPGDLLWVRETWAEGWTYAGERPAVFYRSTMDGLSHCQHILNCDRMLGATAPSEGTKWRPSIHMPRWASRLTLRITDVRAQRLQEISEEDAAAEGFIRLKATGRFAVEQGDQYAGMADHDPRKVFASLWDRLYGPGSWDANPWVWALSFEIIRKNVDEVMA